jgi:hypothetical protein
MHCTRSLLKFRGLLLAKYSHYGQRELLKNEVTQQSSTLHLRNRDGDMAQICAMKHWKGFGDHLISKLSS